MRVEFLTPVYVEHIPEVSQMEPGKLYISKRYHTANHLCACGCGNQTVTPLEGPFSWRLQEDELLRTVTLNPSIGNTQFACRSHYFVINNYIKWC